MKEKLTNQDVARWLECIVSIIHENRNYLTELDAAIGDADHGANMDRGFQAVYSKMDAIRTMDIATQLKTVATTLISAIGGASGPLYGTAFLRAGATVGNKSEMDRDDIVHMLEAFIGGVVTRGKAQAGEKTMLDALLPALSAAQAAQYESLPLSEVVIRAAQSAEEGMKATIPMQATKGRASYLGERSIGHQDPGATSSWLIMQCLAEITSGKNNV